jgi:hypothetical protein
MLIKITESDFTVIFRPYDVIRVVPILLDEVVDGYFVDLAKNPVRLHISIGQANRLFKLLNTVDISIDLDEEDTFEKIMSDLIDSATIPTLESL